MTAIGDSPLYGGSLEDRTLPPPPPEGNLEVTIRTMEDDLALLRKSGGVISAGTLPVTTVDLSGKPIAQQAPAIGAGKDRSQFAVWGIVLAVGAVVLFLTGYYLIPLAIDALSGAPETNSPPQNKATDVGSSRKPVEPLSFGHASLFTNPPAEINLDLYARGAPPDRNTFIRDLAAAASAAAGARGAGGGAAAAQFFEIIPRGADGRPFSWTVLTGLLGAGEIGESFFNEYFSPDYTMFAVQSKNTLYPGFIFKLKQGENPILLQKETLALEERPSAFGKLFLNDAGAPAGVFRDTQVSGQPARMLLFSSAGAGAADANTFYYGWFFQNYLIMSTHEQGLRGAIEHL